ncbi:MAG TPA: methylated-DNA--[protein]-cysteine S-methyltransferase [Salinimicrobium sp.]|nr:methylated-DNA--[protein]-cysteine S-methyltransferase [Salinimicrobium sp.]
MPETSIRTPLGIAVIQGDQQGISQFYYSSDPPAVPKEVPSELKEAAAQVKEYFEGKRKNFQLNLNPSGTIFEKRVWNQLLQIPFGKTISYLELAKNLGDPNVIRAAASANGKNPLWILIPCHRVIGSDGSLTGYAGGLSRKKWLLNHESSSKQQSLFELYPNS